jgi:hypothetical protein
LQPISSLRSHDPQTLLVSRRMRNPEIFVICEH